MGLEGEKARKFKGSEAKADEAKEKGLHLLDSSISIHTHLCQGGGPYGLPAGVHDLHNQAVSPSLPTKDCPAAVSADLHWMRPTDWRDVVT